MPQVVEAIIPAANMGLRYADRLLKDINARDFARLPKGIQTNHPAFVFGHLSVYPDKIMPDIGLGAIAKPDQKYLDLFDAGKECKDDPSGSIYPPMAEIVARFRERHAALMEKLPSVKDEVLWTPNPNERSREFFPTQAPRLTFYLTGHMQMHLGQVSAWRRIMGMPSAM
ncbi:MAG TPA: hypothetical protein VG797_10050 [Phycisphaerales bacterium]|nr:hypothetical protein [Phycisphaerales bacterium]